MDLRVKIVVTGVAGGLTYLLTNATGQPEIWQLTMSVFVGGIVLVVQVLIDTDLRVHRLESELTAHADRVESELTAHAKRVEDNVDNRFAAVNEATALYGRVEATALRPDLMTRVVTALANINPEAELQRSFADHEIARMAELFEGLKYGWALYEGEDRDWLLGLTACVKESVDATSMTTFDKPRGYVDEGQFWASDLGQRYLDSQHRAIDRGVRIRRLFLLDDGAAADKDKIDALIEPHQKIGVQTRILAKSSLDFLLQTNLVDFVLFDHQISYELVAASTLGNEFRPVIAKVTLVAGKPSLMERRNRFDKMWASAQPAP
ncbi:hypothetical protein [Actinoplanes sp. NPDC049118]|uniref:hypothetical protein n=1 Tax=Actinoplanes sp. NPDC049118 TaxID=3155769 RepID=UPI0033C5EC8D